MTGSSDESGKKIDGQKDEWAKTGSTTHEVRGERLISKPRMDANLRE